MICAPRKRSCTNAFRQARRFRQECRPTFAPRVQRPPRERLTLNAVVTRSEPVARSRRASSPVPRRDNPSGPSGGYLGAPDAPECARVAPGVRNNYLPKCIVEDWHFESAFQDRVDRGDMEPCARMPQRSVPAVSTVMPKRSLNDSVAFLATLTNMGSRHVWSRTNSSSHSSGQHQKRCS